MTYTYPNKQTAETLKEFQDQLKKRVEEITGNKIIEVWMDIGNSVYDLHIELFDEHKECTDLYFKINGEEMKGVYTTDGGKISYIFGEQKTQELITAITSYKVQEAA